MNELNKPEIYGRQERKAIEAEKRQQLSFLDFYNQYSERKKLKGQRIQGAAFQWYKRFNKGKQIAFSQITVEHLEEYKFFLEQQITSGELASYTGSQYFDHLKMAINEAERFDYLSNNPNNKVKEIKVIKKESTFLTEEELSQLENLPCTSETVKRACLFAAYTGLRRGDVMGLTWEMIVEISPNNFSLKKLIEKANKFEVIPLSNKALSFLGYRLEPTSRVFWFSNYDLSKHLKPWVSQLKNGKKVTFHTFRHSFASNLLLKGEPITNVSKLLTHSTVTQTLNTYSHVNSEHLRKTTNQFS